MPDSGLRAGESHIRKAIEALRIMSSRREDEIPSVTSIYRSGFEVAIDVVCSFAESALDQPGNDLARAVVDEQANDEGLWFIAATVPEAYLQQELRKLHAAIESALAAGGDDEVLFEGHCIYQTKTDDSSEPVTREWFVEKLRPNAGYSLQVTAWIYIFVSPENEVWLHTGDGRQIQTACKTRGDLRQLVKLLGG